MSYKDPVKATINPIYNDQYPELAGKVLTFLSCYGGDRYYCVAPEGYTGYMWDKGYIPGPSMPIAHWDHKAIVKVEKSEQFRRADEITAKLTEMEPTEVKSLHQPIPGTTLVIIHGLAFAYFAPRHPYFNGTDMKGGLSRHCRVNYTPGGGCYTSLSGPDALHEFHDAARLVEA